MLTQRCAGGEDYLFKNRQGTVNLSVWLLEQLVKIDFEFLSVSYIISELFLLSLFLMLQETEKLNSISEKESVPEKAGEVQKQEVKTYPFTESDIPNEQFEFFVKQLNKLTPTEKMVYNMYISGKSTKDVLSELNIKENTLKYHNKNIYGKLGVSSRKQLVEIAGAISSE